MGGNGHCLPLSIENQLSQQGIFIHTMKVLRPAIADFMGETLTEQADLNLQAVTS